MSFFDDLFEGDNFGNVVMSTAMGAGTGFLMGGPAGAAVGGGLGFAAGVEGNRQARKAQAADKSARRQAKLEAADRQNQLVAEQFNRRRAQFNMGGGNLSPGQQNASNAGTNLQASASNSILGGS